MSAARTGAGPPAETAAARARRARGIARRLARRYPEAAIPLRHANPFQLLVATILSAQSTDAQVNAITPGLFQRYRTPADFAGARRQDLEKAIHSTGFSAQRRARFKMPAGCSWSGSAETSRTRWKSWSSSQA